MQEKKYQLSVDNDVARIVYAGEIHNKDIENAHMDLRNDDSFLHCKALIIDLLNCTLEKVDVNGLLAVNATDLGASFAVTKLKVGFIVQCNINMERTSEFINKSIKLLSPWEWRHFQSEENALQWFGES